MDESRVSNSENCPTAASHLRRDRLSELPDSLILEILSLLQMKYVVRTTILSKRWKDLWTDVTSLDFGFSHQTFVEGALAKWKGAKILIFGIGFLGSSPPSDFVDSCLLIPMEKHVEELYVFFEPYVGVEFLAPQRLCSCSSITKLSLFHCDLKIGENVNVQWNQLKSLTIEDSSNLSEDVMNRILCGAPLLEELMLLSLNITEKLNIQSSSLKTLRIGWGYYSENSAQLMVEGMLRIWAPNLLSLEISACVYSTCLLDAPSLTTAVICFEEDFDINDDRIDNDFPPLEMFDQFFRSLRHVEKFTLSCLSIEFLLDMKGNYMVVPFSKTKYLKLYPNKAEELLHVLGMFPEVKMLVAELNKDLFCYFDDDEPHPAMVGACSSLAPKMTFPNPSLLQLKTVEITCYMYDASIIPVVEILLENAHVLEKMVLRLIGREDHEKTFMLAKKKVLRMPRSSPTAQVIIYFER